MVESRVHRESKPGRLVDDGGMSAIARVAERPGSPEPGYDGIGIYLHDISRVGLLDRVDEGDLGRRIETSRSLGTWKRA